MKLLVIEPLEGRGMRIRVTDGVAWKTERQLEHGQDISQAIHSLGKVADGIEGVVIRARVGSFSASRTALVAGNVLSATRGIPLVVVEKEIETVAELLTAVKHAKKNFEYQAPPHIT